LRTFLLHAQQESALIEKYETTIDVHLMNGFKITVNIVTTECTSQILEKALKSIGLSDELIFYFGLFLMRKDINGRVTLLRKFMDFESPFISLQYAEDCQIVIRKNYWDANYDLEIMRDNVALNLLYIQSQSDVEEGWTIASNETRQILSEIYVSGKKHEFMNIVRNLPYYGTLHFSNVISDFPEVDLNANIIVGNQELAIIITDGESTQETKFRVTRMRCWRVTTIANTSKKYSDNYSYELSFEYLMSKNCLKWVKLITEQAMLISVCLQVSSHNNELISVNLKKINLFLLTISQSMVDELLNQKNGSDINNMNIKSSLDTQLEYIKIRRDDINSSEGSLNLVREF
jgi:sorting nexin-17